MAVHCDTLLLGQTYSRPELAALWGYRDWHAVGRGVVTPRGQDVVVLFITKEKQAALEQYADEFDGELLRMEGEVGHATDQRLAQSPGGDRVYLSIESAITARSSTAARCSWPAVSLRRETAPAASSSQPRRMLRRPSRPSSPRRSRLERLRRASFPIPKAAGSTFSTSPTSEADAAGRERSNFTVRPARSAASTSTPLTAPRWPGVTLRSTIPARLRR
jgi:hypothetical protein